jgi:uncharacterized Zn finger protein (UPF0148 family)
MSYLVVGCPDCGTPRVAPAGNDTATCHRCGRQVRLDDVPVHARTDSLEAAQNAVGQVNAQRDGGELAEAAVAEPEARDALDRALVAAREVSGERATVRRAAEGLTEELDTFTEDTWVEALGRLDVPEPRALEHLERLQRANLVVEPEHEVYRALG